MRTLILLPTYNERENMSIVLAIRHAVPSADVLIIDDNSTDGTAERADRLCDDDTQISVLHRASKDGLGNAYRAGYAYGIERGYDVIAQLDADYSHPVAALPELIGAIEGGADVAIGSRWTRGGRVRNWPRHREVLSRTANRAISVLLRSPVRDATAGFRAYRVATMPHPAETNAAGFAFQMEMTHAACQKHLRVVEVPITFTDRTHGTSKMSRAVITEAARTLARLARTR